jgi:hypothetical protein
MSEIGRANAAYGPSCDKPTMPLSLQMFDLGSYSGEGQMRISLIDRVALCICNEDGERCPGDEVAKSTSRLSKSADVQARESEGVLWVTNKLAGHRCLDASIGVALYKMGFECGWLDGLKSESVRLKVEEMYLKVFEPKTDDVTAHVRELADACFNRL